MPKKEELKTIKPNWAVLEISYSIKIVLPVKEATELLALIGKANKYLSEFGGKKDTIIPLCFDVPVKFISDDEYKKLRLNHILGVNDAINID